MKGTIIFALAAALCLAGCATQSFEPGQEPEFEVREDFAKFYQTGPGQERGPDASLRTGERFKMLRREMGYSFVLLEDGRTGYVANEEMASAPPEPPVEPETKRSRKKSNGSEDRDFPEPAPGEMPDLSELPEAVEVFHPGLESEIPADAKPEFRY
jgi:hypothetical protein